MAKYAVSLPNKIPNRFFRHLDGNVDKSLIKTIDGVYSQVAKTGATEADSPHQAIRHLIFRELGSTVTAASLARMFGCESARDYAFKVPERGYISADGKRLSEHSADVFQKMELAMIMADARSRPGMIYGPEQFFADATDMVNACNGKTA